MDVPVTLAPCTPDILTRLERLEQVLGDLEISVQGLTLQLTQLHGLVGRTDHYGLRRDELPFGEAFTRHHGMT